MILGGTDAPVDGWEIRFDVVDGVLRARGDQTGDGAILGADAEIAFTAPADPLPIGLRGGDPDDPWRTADADVFVIVPLPASDAVARVRLDNGLVDALWR